MELNHMMYGNGTATINGKYVDCDFPTVGKKRLSIEWLCTHDNMIVDLDFADELMKAYHAILDERASVEREAEQKRIEAEKAQREEVLRQVAERNKALIRRVNNIDTDFYQMFHVGANDFTVESDKDFYFVLGFIAGHAKSVNAQMTWDRVDDFLSIFPDSEYHEVRRDTDRGDCCFRINFKKDITVPAILETALVETQNGYQLNKSAFAFRLAKDYGLMFGDAVANISLMRELASQANCAEEFENGYFY